MATPASTRPAPLAELHVDSLSSAERIRVTKDCGYFPRSVVTRDGAIVIVYRAGAGHMGSGGYLASVRSEDNGRTWSEPVTVVASPPNDDRNPALGIAHDGTLVCAFWRCRLYNSDGTRIPPDQTPKESDAYRTGFAYSTDGGRSWGEPVFAPAGEPWSHYSPFGRILTVRDGRLALPVYLAKKTWLIWSSDNGRTWEDLTLVAEDINETAYCVLPSGEWVLVGRENNGTGMFSLVRWSQDVGRTWSAPVQFLENRRLPSDLVVLSDGSLLAVHGYRTIPRGVRAVRSTDGGRTWGSTDLVLLEGKPNTDLGYPTVEVEDGWVVIAYYDASAAPEDKTDPTGAYLEVVRVREQELIERVR